MTTLIHTIIKENIGQTTLMLPCPCEGACPKCNGARPIHLGSCLGQVQPGDIGKRLYLTQDEANGRNVVQAESAQQFETRTRKASP